MTQEEKDLLIVDLCGRLPYGLKVHYKTAGWEDKNCTLSPQMIDNFLIRRDVDVKPYLRPLSSITEEEKYDYITNVKKEKCIVELPILPKIEATDWLNKKMFDFRGLIPKDLALSTDEFNPYVEDCGMDEDKLYEQYLYDVSSFEKYGSNNVITFDEWKWIKFAMENTRPVCESELNFYKELLGHTTQDIDTLE